MNMKCLFLMAIIVISSLSVCSAVSYRWEDGADIGWHVPTTRDFPYSVKLDHKGGLSCSQELYDVQTGEYISDGGNPDFIYSQSMFHTLLYTCQVKGTPHNQRIVIPIYLGGDIRIYTDWNSISKKQSWANICINGWWNEEIGKETSGNGNYSLPDAAFDKIGEINL